MEIKRRASAILLYRIYLRPVRSFVSDWNVHVGASIAPPCVERATKVINLLMLEVWSG